MQLPAAAVAPRTETPDRVAFRLKHGLKMEDVVGFLESVNRTVELKVIECRRCWEDYVKSFANYTSVIRINGKPLLPPAMNPDRREAMRACRDRLTNTIARRKSKRKDLMAKVEFAVDDVESLSGDPQSAAAAPRARAHAAAAAEGPTISEWRTHSRTPTAAAATTPAEVAVPFELAMARQRLGGAEGAERSPLTCSGTRRSSSCSNLYQQASSSSVPAEAAEQAKRAPSPSPGRPGDGAALGRRPPSPPIGAAGAAAVAASRNRLAVRYMSVGAGTTMFRQPFFPPVGSLAVQTKASPSTASLPNSSVTTDVQLRLLDRVALAASCDSELDADVSPGSTAAGGAGARDGGHGAVGASTHRPRVPLQHAGDPGERREADGKAAGEEGDDFRTPACLQKQSVENGDCADTLVAASQLSAATTLTADTNLPSHLRGSASMTDTLASTVLGHDAELAASCCCSFDPDDRGGRHSSKDADVVIVVSGKSSASVCDLPSAAVATASQSPPKLLRSNSYTLKSPSPALLRAQRTACREPAQATPDAPPPGGAGADGSLVQAAAATADRRVGGGDEMRRSAQRRLAFECEHPTGDFNGPLTNGRGLSAVAAAAGSADRHRAASVPHPDENGVGSDDAPLGHTQSVAPQQLLLTQQRQPADPGHLHSRCHHRKSVSTADENDDGDDGEVAAEARRGLVLLKSKFHDRLLTRMRGTPLLGADYRRPSTALPLAGGRTYDAGEAAQPPARPSTATGIADRCAAGSPTSHSTPADKSVVTSECSQWLAVPESDVFVVHHDILDTFQVGDEQSRMSTRPRGGLSILAACVRGYLTRRLLETEKVKFLMKTVQDCQHLLVNLNNQKYHITASKTSQSAAGMDAGLRERIAAQLTSALGQIHDLFFIAPVQKRMALIRQHRILEAERRLNALIRSNSAETRRQRISTAASRAAEKRIQERMPGGRPKSAAMPRRSTSPKKASVLCLGRVTKTIHRRSPVRRSGDGPRKRLEAVEHVNGN